jgi:hypothetical protein
MKKSPSFHQSFTWLISCFTLCLLVFSKNSAANVVGVGTQNFNSTPDGLGFVSVQSAETLDPGIINLGFFVNYAINSLPHWNDPTEGRLELNDTLLSSEINAAVGVTEKTEFGISLPAVLAQTVNDTASTYGFFSQAGLSEIRLNSKYRFYTGANWSSALVATVNFNLIQNDPFSGTDSKPTLNLEGVLERKFFDRLLVALNFGHRWRSPGAPTDPLVTPLKNQFIASLGASYRLASIDTKLIAEIFTSFPSGHANNQGGRSASSAELLGGIKHDFTNKLALHAGAGTELEHGASSPDWRVYSGINYAFGPVFKKDGRSFSKRARGRYVGYINFDFDSAEMIGPFEETLLALATSLKDEGGFKDLIIEGHTDSIGPESYNLDLSQRRANSIRDYLIKKFSYDPAHVKSEGYGETRPDADNASYQGRQKNRRVEFQVVR